MQEIIIQNCTWKFQIQCPKRWETLHETEDERVRFCDVCMKEVTKCDSDEEVSQAAAAGKCVSLTVDDGAGNVSTLGGLIELIDDASYVA